MKVSPVKKRVLRKKIFKASEGLFSTIIDAALFTLFLPSASLGAGKGSYGVYQTFQEAHELLQDINYKSLKGALYNIKKKGLIKNLKRGLLEVKITKSGYQRLNSFLPQYQEKRTWDKMIYLISYDISIKNNHKRNLLRNYLIKLGAVKLQNSLYLTPYNPKKILKTLVKENKVKGQILISTLGRDSSVGDLDLKNLISKAYGLKEINERYHGFIKKYKNAKEVISKSQVALEFYSILKEDPQLPFEILPSNFLSDQAYLIFKRLTF